MKKKYVKSEMEIIEFDIDDVITTSSHNKNTETLEEAYEDDGEGSDPFGF